MSNDLLSTREVAEALGVDYSTVTYWVRKGKLKPAHTISGRAYLFRPAQVDKLRKARTLKASA